MKPKPKENDYLKTMNNKKNIKLQEKNLILQHFSFRQIILRVCDVLKIEGAIRQHIFLSKKSVMDKFKDADERREIKDTRTRLRKIVGFSDNAFYAWMGRAESGKVKFPKSFLENLIVFSYEKQVSLFWLLTGHGPDRARRRDDFIGDFDDRNSVAEDFFSALTKLMNQSQVPETKKKKTITS